MRRVDEGEYGVLRLRKCGERVCVCGNRDFSFDPYVPFVGLKRKKKVECFGMCEQGVGMYEH